MGIRDTIRGKRTYFDANIFIYLLEGYSAFEEALLEIRDSILNREAEIFTSDLTLCEVLVAPFRRNHTELASRYRQFIEDSGAFALLPTTRDTYIRASLYRAQLRLKIPDALHMASAVENGCSAFVTNDKALKAPKGIEVVGL